MEAPLAALSIRTTGYPSAERNSDALARDAVFAALTLNFAGALNAQGGAPEAEFTTSRPSTHGNAVDHAAFAPRERPSSQSAADRAAPAREASQGATASLAAQPGAPAQANAAAVPASAQAAPALALSPGLAIAVGLVRTGPAGETRLASTAPAAPTRPASPASAPPPLRAAVPSQGPSFETLVRHRMDETGARFQLRLDPPSLGRIEGVIDLGDNGESSIRLTFDTRHAYDLFRQDEAALRQLLTDAGVDLGAHGFELAFAPTDDPEHSPDAADIASEFSIADTAPIRADLGVRAIDLMA